MSWAVIAGIVGMLLAAGVAVWYKYKAQSSAMDAWLAKSSQDEAEKSQALAEKQLVEKAKLEKEELDEQIRQAKAIEDPDARRARLLAILVRVRSAS